ncbi:hypothetical protein NHJ13734_002158 [Beauveria thailandica]
MNSYGIEMAVGTRYQPTTNLPCCPPEKPISTSQHDKTSI